MGIFAADFFDVIRTRCRRRVGAVSISPSTIIIAILLLLFGFIATRAVQRWLDRRFLPRTGLDPGLQNSVSVLFGYAGVITALIIALAELGIDLQKIALIAGALSVGIGFGLQSVVSNFVWAFSPGRATDPGRRLGAGEERRRLCAPDQRARTEIETFDRASVIVPIRI